jgi:glycosyltransferase involved in cell wall biosynthesis
MKPKLLVLASTFPGKPGDGTPAFVLDLAWQQAKDFDVTVLTPMTPGAETTETIPSPDGATSVSVVRYRYFLKRFEDLADGAILDNLRAKPSRFLQVPFLAHGLFWTTRRLVKQLGPVAIHAHWVIPQGILATLAAPGVPLLVTTHGGDIYALNAAPLLALKRWVFKRSAAISTVNAQMKQQLVAWGQSDSKISLLPMGVDTAAVAKIAAATAKVPGQMLVVGRLVEKKGIEFLLEALRLLEERGVSVGKLVVIGDGPIRAQLEAKAKGLAVEFRGQQGRQQVLSAIAESELMLIPSVTASNGDQGGLPVTLLEGGAGGVCVIASRLPGIDEVIVDSESGLLVQQRDQVALAGAIERALANPELRASLAAGIATSVKRFDINVIGAGYNEVLKGIAK